MKKCIKCNNEKELTDFYKNRTDCITCHLSHNKGYYQKNRERVCKISLSWAHSERGKESRRISQKKRIGTEKYRDYARKWSRTEKGKKCRRDRWNRWVKTEKGKETNLRKVHKRRNILLNILSTLTGEEWKDILFSYSNRCYYCNTEFTEILRPTRDHIIPIIKGGAHIKENIVPACRPCNSSKGGRVVG